MTGHIYRDDILEQDVRLFRVAMDAEFLFMDDNARLHHANIVDECLQSDDISRMDWPAYSPDMNPLKHVWDVLSRRIAARQPPPTCLPELRRVLLDEWCNIPQDQIDNLILSMPRGFPPGEPAILDEEGAQVKGLIGPYNEGDSLLLICEAIGVAMVAKCSWPRTQDWRYRVTSSYSTATEDPPCRATAAARGELGIPWDFLHSALQGLSRATREAVRRNDSLKILLISSWQNEVSGLCECSEGYPFPFLPKSLPSHFPKDHSGMEPIERRSFLLSFPGVLYSSAHVNNYSHYSWTKPGGQK
ncbi:transposable element Tcb1 transposase [Trichonephila clavipes]|nr:transposable element Tcb1 transposase [Trichonephila clavipes]